METNTPACIQFKVGKVNIQLNCLFYLAKYNSICRCTLSVFKTIMTNSSIHQYLKLF